MKIKSIFVSAVDSKPGGLYSIQYDQSGMSEYKRVRQYWRDHEALYAFFNNHITDLKNSFWGNLSIDDAISTTMMDADRFEDALLTYCQGGKYELQFIFQPLYNNEYRLISLQKSKGKIRRSWLRLYALRLERNCFVITGGAIKLTHNMQAPHLQEELNKLERAKIFLQSNDIYIPEDLNNIL
jgi:hypothetical protein